MERGYMQHRAELSRLDDSVVRDRRAFEEQASRAAAAERAANAAFLASGGAPGPSGAVPGQDGYLYDPRHHAADYAGLVHKDLLEKAHFEGKHREHVAYGDHGVAPAPGVATTDHVAGEGRKHFSGDARFESREVVPGTAPLFADPTYYVAGGRPTGFEARPWSSSSSSPRTGTCAWTGAPPWAGSTWPPPSSRGSSMAGKGRPEATWASART
jgi:hypothetical protein